MAKSPFWSATKLGVSIAVRLTPNASQSVIVGPQIRDDNKQVLRVRVIAVPEKGKANKALIALLAKTLKLPKNAITINAGHTSRHKTMSIVGDPAPIIAIFSALE